MANAKRRCTQCKTYKPATSMQIKPAGAFCDMKCLMTYANDKKNTDRLVKIGRKEANKQLSKKKSDLNRSTISWQHKQTQKTFNKMRVTEELEWFADRGLEPTCISCSGTIGNDQWCCGHFKTQGGNSRLRYDRKNTFLQHNHRCNLNLSGDIEGTTSTHGYKLGLIKRFGEIEGNKIIDYCASNVGPKKWTCEELEDIRSQFSLTTRKILKRAA